MVILSEGNILDVEDLPSRLLENPPQIGSSLAHLQSFLGPPSPVEPSPPYNPPLPKETPEGAIPVSLDNSFPNPLDREGPKGESSHLKLPPLHPGPQEPPLLEGDPDPTHNFGGTEGSSQAATIPQNQEGTLEGTQEGKGEQLEEPINEDAPCSAHNPVTYPALDGQLEIIQGLPSDISALIFPLLKFPEGGIDLNALLKTYEGKLIDGALEAAGGFKNNSARLLGINRTTLQEKLKKRELSENFPPGVPVGAGQNPKL
jgi:hypothetical protein